MIAISLTAWPPYARIARAETASIARSDFIAAAVLQGASSARILVRHIAPLCLSSLIVRLTLDMAGIILTAAGLGFLGLGAQPPTPEWGAMVASGRDVILDQWWVATIPGMAIFVASLGFNLLGDGLRDVFDPKSSDDASRSSRSRDLDVTLPSRGGDSARGARRELHARTRAARHRRRVGLRQVDDRARDPRPVPPPRRRDAQSGSPSTASTSRALYRRRLAAGCAAGASRW